MSLNRRMLFKQMALGGVGLAYAQVPSSPKIGLQLYTLRSIMGKAYVPTLEKVAEIGFKKVEPAGDYGGLTPKEFRATLDRLGLSVPSTHIPVTEGPTLEKELEGYQIMGVRYTTVKALQPVRAGRTKESIQRQAAQLNEQGKLVKKFGLKILVHNHAGEFKTLEDSPLKPYDILLAETDPATVAMELDIGWAHIGGQNVLEMFKKTPGRFELWHVKDVKGLKNCKLETLGGRDFVPIGFGDINYKPIFAEAATAGMKHFIIEQDNAADWGDCVAAARVNYQNLSKLLAS
jgi:sugar phosphate isomerase/epimerase